MMPLPRCLPSFVSLHDLHSGLLLAAAVALSPFICLPSWSPFWAAPCLPSFVSLHSLSFASQCRFLCPPPPASPFIAFHLSPSFFGNAIWGLCRCNAFRKIQGLHQSQILWNQNPLSWPHAEVWVAAAFGRRARARWWGTTDDWTEVAVVRCFHERLFCLAKFNNKPITPT